MPDDLAKLIRHVERENVHSRADEVADVEAILPEWALTADRWPPKWRALLDAVQELPEIERGPAERRVQSRFLRALARRPPNRRSVEDMAEPD